MSEQHKKFFSYPDWENDPNFTFIGSEINPHTKRKYDFWLYTDKWCETVHTYNRPRFKYSFIERHGIGPGEYGSGPISVSWYDCSHFGDDFKKDFLWGIYRSQLLCLYYLAAGERPALIKPEDFCWMF